MSSTNRGQERIADDVYPTPAWTVDRLLDGFPELPGNFWLEPCVGTGAIVRAVKRRRPHIDFAGIDVRVVAEESMASGCFSFVHGSFGEQTYLSVCGVGQRAPDVLVTNPPFSSALEIAKFAVSTGAWVALLLRLNFLGSGTKAGKGEWLRAHPPDVGVLPQRPSFAASLKCAEDCGWRVMQELELPRLKICPLCAGRVTCTTSDSVEYAWFVWPPGAEKRRAGRIMVLPDTPESERKVPR